MVFIVIEIQSNDETATMLTNTYTDRNEADSKFHQILTTAAISSVPIHGAVLLTDTGQLLRTETYEHEVTE